MLLAFNCRLWEALLDNDRAAPAPGSAFDLVFRGHVPTFAAAAAPALLEAFPSVAQTLSDPAASDAERRTAVAAASRAAQLCARMLQCQGRVQDVAVAWRAQAAAGLAAMRQSGDEALEGAIDMLGQELAALEASSAAGSHSGSGGSDAGAGPGLGSSQRGTSGGGSGLWAAALAWLVRLARWAIGIQPAAGAAASTGAAAPHGTPTAAAVPTCAACGATAEGAGVRKLLRCSGCQVVRYCGPACQRAHWRGGHKTECAGLAAAGAH